MIGKSLSLLLQLLGRILVPFDFLLNLVFVTLQCIAHRLETFDKMAYLVVLSPVDTGSGFHQHFISIKMSLKITYFE